VEDNEEKRKGDSKKKVELITPTRSEGRSYGQETDSSILISKSTGETLGEEGHWDRMRSEEEEGLT